MFEKKEHQNSGTLDKDTINNWIIPFLSVGKRGFKSNFDLASIFLLILKRLKTGVPPLAQACSLCLIHNSQFIICQFPSHYLEPIIGFSHFVFY